ncbi:MAG: rhomboid family intramembrane serine protease [Devosia sp.]|nr:rhomboid family intramembrane serine protease [Devosia sp.]
MTEQQNPQENQMQGMRQPVFLLPTAVTALCGLLVAVHLARGFVLNEAANLQVTVWFAFIPYRLLAGEEIPGALLPLIWTPFTHAFLHAGWEHLLFNIVWLAIFATPVARRYSAVATITIFLVGAVAGAIAFAATTLPELQILVGASGGVAALTGAAVRFVFQPVIIGEDPETGEKVVLGRRLAGLGEVLRNPRSRYFALIWVTLNGAVPLFPLVTGDAIAIAWQAHLGGFFAGLLLVPFFERRPAGGTN